MDQDKKLQELKAIQIELQNLRQELQSIDLITNQDQVLSSTLDRLQIECDNLNALNYQGPIIKNIDFPHKLTLDAHLHIQAWDWDKNFSEPKRYLQEDIEVDNEDNVCGPTVLTNSRVHINIWAKASIIEWDWLYGWDNKYTSEVLTKEFDLRLHIDKEGNFKVLHFGEKVEEHNPKKIEEYQISLSSILIEKGSCIRIKAEGLLTGKVKEQKYKNWDTRELSETITFSDQVVAAIAPTICIYTNERAREVVRDQELYFESENQAILSSDQLHVLNRWWEHQPSHIKQLIKEGKATIEIVGFTSPTGTDEYNLSLGEKRAEHVKKMLNMIIGKDSSDNYMADIHTASKGELSKFPKRYVSINVIIK